MSATSEAASQAESLKGPGRIITVHYLRKDEAYQVSLRFVSVLKLDFISILPSFIIGLRLILNLYDRLGQMQYGLVQ